MILKGFLFVFNRRIWWQLSQSNGLTATCLSIQSWTDPALTTSVAVRIWSLKCVAPVSAGSTASVRLSHSSSWLTRPIWFISDKWHRKKVPTIYTFSLVLVYTTTRATWCGWSTDLEYDVISGYKYCPLQGFFYAKFKDINHTQSVMMIAFSQ